VVRDHLGGPGSIILMVMTTCLMSTLTRDVMQAKPRSITFVPTICLHQLLPSTTGFMVLINYLY
jgi:hypothetical protein